MRQWLHTARFLLRRADLWWPFLQVTLQHEAEPISRLYGLCSCTRFLFSIETWFLWHLGSLSSVHFFNEDGSLWWSYWWVWWVLQVVRINYNAGSKEVFPNYEKSVLNRVAFDSQTRQTLKGSSKSIMISFPKMFVNGDCMHYVWENRPISWHY